MGRDFVRRDSSYTLGATVENRQAPTFLPGLKESCQNSVLRTSQALTKARRSGEGCYRLNSGVGGQGCLEDTMEMFVRKWKGRVENWDKSFDEQSRKEMQL